MQDADYLTSVDLLNCSQCIKIQAIAINQYVFLRLLLLQIFFMNDFESWISDLVSERAKYQFQKLVVIQKQLKKFKEVKNIVRSRVFVVCLESPRTTLYFPYGIYFAENFILGSFLAFWGNFWVSSFTFIASAFFKLVPSIADMEQITTTKIKSFMVCKCILLSFLQINHKFMSSLSHKESGKINIDGGFLRRAFIISTVYGLSPKLYNLFQQSI